MGPERKKILLLVDWFYPGFKAGGPVQSCRNFVAAMESEYNMVVVCSDRDLGDMAPYPSVKVNEWNDYTPHTKVFYASALSLKQLQQLISDTAPDYLYLNSLFSLRYAIFPLWLLWRNRIKAQVVLAPRGMLQEGALRFSQRKKKLCIGWIKGAGLPQRIVFQATDTQELRDILHWFPRAKKVIEATNFPRMHQPPLQLPVKNSGTLDCLFISRISPKKNLHWLLPQLHQLPAGIRLTLTIKGDATDKEYIRQLQQQANALPPDISVRLEGPVNNDAIIDCIRGYHIFVLPTLGENFGHAIFEALAAGRPVLVSDKTPWRELRRHKAGWDIALEEKQAWMDTLTAAAAMPQQEYNEWCRGAWQLAHDFYNHEALYKGTRELFST